MRGKLKLLALLAVLGLVAAACGGEEEEPEASPPAVEEESPSPPAEEALPGEGFLACQVTDTGGIDDKSFNQTAWEGFERAETELGVEIAFLESQSEADYEPNLQAFIDRGCDIIISIGFLLGDATAAAAEANPDQAFAIQDFAYDPPIPNVKGIVYSTNQAATLAGYAAASWTKTKKVGTYGGINIGPPVTDFMNGFWVGVQLWNEAHDDNVEVLGWDPAAQDGLFTGDFENQDNGRRLTEDLIAEGADVILPVAGPVGLGTAAAVEDSPEDDVVIWVDTDGCISAEEFCSIFLTSIQKRLDNTSFDTIQSVVDGTFTGGDVFVGTLENEGVAMAPFHEFEDEISDEVKAEIEEIRQGIIDGSVSADYNDYL